MRRILILAAAAACFMLAASCDCGQQDPVLEQVTIVSRHGARAPLGHNHKLDKMVDTSDPARKWLRWNARGGHLTLRGSVLEYASGVYWGHVMREAGLKCDPSEVYFSASPRQRTVWTARNFAAGAFPDMDIDVQYSGPRDFKPELQDTRFLPILNSSPASTGVPFDTLAFQAEVMREYDSLAAAIPVDYEYIENLLGLQRSRYGKPHFDRNLRFTVLFGPEGTLEEPTHDGTGLSDARSAADALLLQYYEMADEQAAALGQQLDFDDWKRVAGVVSASIRILFSAPIVSVDTAHDMLLMLRDNIVAPGRKFNFFCTHDSMLMALISALRVQPYELEGAIEPDTPVGTQIVFEKWRKGHEELGRVKLVYDPVERIKAETPAEILSGSPASIDLEFVGMERNADGFYAWEEVLELIDRTIAAYDLAAVGQNPFAGQ